MRNLASFSTLLDFERPAFENAAGYLKSETNYKLGHDPSVSSASLVQFGPRTHAHGDLGPGQKFDGENVLNRE